MSGRPIEGLLEVVDGVEQRHEFQADHVVVDHFMDDREDQGNARYSRQKGCQG